VVSRNLSPSNRLECFLQLGAGTERESILGHLEVFRLEAAFHSGGTIRLLP
jgi:hypothetical protein